MSERVVEHEGENLSLAQWRIVDMVSREKGEHPVRVGAFDFLADSVQLIEKQPADLSAPYSAVIGFRYNGTPTFRISHTPGGESGFAYGRDELTIVADEAEELLFNRIADGILRAQHNGDMTPVDQQG